MMVVKKGGGDGGGSLSGNGCCGLCTYALSCKKSQQSIKKNKKQKTYQGLKTCHLEPPCVVVGCYGSDGGDSGDSGDGGCGCCGCHTCSPV